MPIQMVTFSEPKAGNAPGEWQDGAAGGPEGPGKARFIVVDGATVAYDSLRWVDQLVTSFIETGPTLEPAAMRAWFVQMQDRWAAETPAFDSIIEERKFKEVGSFATMLAFEVCGLDGPEPFWRAVALGDTVLFHVRDDRLLSVFPPLGPEDFGSLPDGVHTLRSSLNRMTERLMQASGVLEPDDLLFAATDAMAQWMLRAIKGAERKGAERKGAERKGAERKVWNALADLAHPAVFARFVEDQRDEADGAKRMKNDDVTLMRLRILAEQPSYLLACR